jgi:hypothetical protein
MEAKNPFYSTYVQIAERMSEMWWPRGWMAGVQFPTEVKRFFSSPECPDWLWGPPSLLFNGYSGLFFPGGKAAVAWSWPLSSICFHGVSLNWFSTKTPSMSDMNVKNDLFTHPFCCYSVMLVVTIWPKDGSENYLCFYRYCSVHLCLTDCVHVE